MGLYDSKDMGSFGRFVFADGITCELIPLYPRGVVVTFPGGEVRGRSIKACTDELRGKVTDAVFHEVHRSLHSDSWHANANEARMTERKHRIEEAGGYVGQMWHRSRKP